MKEDQYRNFSVLISVYFNETAENLRLSLTSVVNQTIMPNEIVLIKDGPLPDALNLEIDEFVLKFPGLFNLIRLEKNMGLGLALNRGLNVCRNNIIARMDTDDVCFPERFEKQFDYMTAHPDVSVLGCYIEEFNSVPGDLKRYRRLPLTASEINGFSKYRNPLNHPTVFFRKDDVLAAGSYQDMALFEDYFLWARMIKSGFRIINLDAPLLHFRVGNDMIGRRNGYSYVLKEWKFLKAIRNIGFINNKQFFFSICTKLPVRLLPKKMLEFVYKSLLR